MNPARSFGPSVIATNFKDHWVYWVGPFLGAIIAALLYEHIFCPSSGKPSPGQVIPMEQMGAFKDEMGSMQPVKRTMSGVDQLKTKEFWRAVGGEFVAMLLFVFLGIGSTIDWASAPSKSNSTASRPTQSDRTDLISLCFGLSIAMLVRCFGHISGGHINPAVTLAMVVTKKVTIIKGVFYLLAQLVGAVAGAGIVRLVSPPDFRENLGVTGLGKDVSGGMGLLVELLLTFQLVFTIFASCDPKRTDLVGSAAPAIGLSVTIGHEFGIPFTGASMNPARSFGPSVIATNFKDHWVYWVGPFLGAIMAALVYEHIFYPSSDKPSPGRVIPKEQIGAFKDGMARVMQAVRRKKRTERKDPPPTRVSTV
ncbi:aquaporin-4-like [Syngnathus typhle]|uniref:aquaporin-4-like n=1 Tax=Syngnathus typhle TaxID=161592 RepID=UPI002A6A037B|nr:aquaporin-4-like [Syngnathus typhle]